MAAAAGRKQTAPPLHRRLRPLFRRVSIIIVLLLCPRTPKRPRTPRGNLPRPTWLSITSRSCSRGRCRLCSELLPKIYSRNFCAPGPCSILLELLTQVPSDVNSDQLESSRVPRSSPIGRSVSFPRPHGRHEGNTPLKHALTKSCRCFTILRGTCFSTWVTHTVCSVRSSHGRRGLDEAEPWLDEAEPKGRGWTKPSSKVILQLQRALHQRARDLVQRLSFRAQAGEVAAVARFPAAL